MATHRVDRRAFIRGLSQTAAAISVLPDMPERRPPRARCASVARRPGP
jgi:hypothetical protein